MTQPVMLHQLNELYALISDLPDYFFELHTGENKSLANKKAELNDPVPLYRWAIRLVKIFQYFITHWLHFIMKYCNQVAIFIDKEFCKVPGDWIFQEFFAGHIFF